jgi:pimeloyl-ACP methyl ester carboxylesterase
MQVWTLFSLVAVLLAWGTGFISVHLRKVVLFAATLISLAMILLGRFYLPVLPILFALVFAWVYDMLKVSPKKGLSLVLIAVSILFLLFSGMLIYAFPEFQIAKPTGKYLVGTQSLLIDDRIPTQIWYPAASKTESSPYFLEGKLVIDEVAYLFGIPGFALAHFRWIETPAQLNAPVAKDEDSYPVLLFSHGLGAFKEQNISQVIELASHGYVILSIDHPGYAAATVLYDEVLANQHADLLGAESNILDRHIGIWVENLQKVLDELPFINPKFDNRLDLSAIGAFGHSFGGSAAYQLLLVDTRVLAAVNMDGCTFGIISPANKPFLYMNSSLTLDFEEFSHQLDKFTEAEIVEMTGGTKDELRQNFRELMFRRETTLQAKAYSAVIPDIQHIGFSDAVLYSPLLADTINWHSAISDFMLTFFNL